jgi:hypothetical protein
MSRDILFFISREMQLVSKEGCSNIQQYISQPGQQKIIWCTISIIHLRNTHLN